jgi:FkbM family methyltransferase
VLQRIGRFFACNRSNPWIRRTNTALVALHKGYENLNYDFRSNGELEVLRRLATTEMAVTKTIFDVGANRGEWTALATDVFKGAYVHAFEIVPETFARLHARHGDEGNIVLNNVGLSDREGPMTVYFSAEHHGVATCVAGFSEVFHQYQPEARQVRTTTGDAYCMTKNITAIDFLKIDVEGFEPQVLKGFEAMLRAGKIDVLQFEYGYINIDTHFLLKDFYDYLCQFNMTIGKIYPNHVQFRPYRHMDEDFLGPNYLAVRSERNDLISVLGAIT